jgi:hypothetical protein
MFFGRSAQNCNYLSKYETGIIEIFEIILKFIVFKGG